METSFYSSLPFQQAQSKRRGISILQMLTVDSSTSEYKSGKIKNLAY